MATIGYLLTSISTTSMRNDDEVDNRVTMLKKWMSFSKVLAVDGLTLAVQRDVNVCKSQLCFEFFGVFGHTLVLAHESVALRLAVIPATTQCGP